MVQPRVPGDSTLVTLVGIPTVQREGDSVRIAYTLAVWSPGRHRLTIPGAVVVEGSGAVDTLPDATVLLEVASVLPARVAAESIAPREARPWVERSDASPIPFVVLLLPVALCLLAAAWWWRRQGPLVPASHPAAADPAELPGRLEGWLEAGEVVMVIDHLTAALPHGAATARWRERVQECRFDPDASEALLRLAADGLELLRGDGAR
jgi:hypothetical protein